MLCCRGAGWFGTLKEKRLLSKVPLGRFGKDGKVAPFVAYPASLEASCVTGQAIAAGVGLLQQFRDSGKGRQDVGFGLLGDRELYLPFVSATRARIRLCGFTAQPLRALG